MTPSQSKLHDRIHGIHRIHGIYMQAALLEIASHTLTQTLNVRGTSLLTMDPHIMQQSSCLTFSSWHLAGSASVKNWKPAAIDSHGPQLLEPTHHCYINVLMGRSLGQLHLPAYPEVSKYQCNGCIYQNSRVIISMLAKATITKQILVNILQLSVWDATSWWANLHLRMGLWSTLYMWGYPPNLANQKHLELLVASLFPTCPKHTVPMQKVPHL